MTIPIGILSHWSSRLGSLHDSSNKSGENVKFSLQTSNAICQERPQAEGGIGGGYSTSAWMVVERRSLHQGWGELWCYVPGRYILTSSRSTYCKATWIYASESKATKVRPSLPNSSADLLNICFQVPERYTLPVFERRKATHSLYVRC